MKNSKKIILSILTFAMFVCLGLVNSVSAYAEGVVVNFHYTTSDSSKYKLAIWEDSGKGTDYDFTQNGNEGVIKYTCANPDLERVSFFVKVNDGSGDINANRGFDIEPGDSVIDVYITPGKEEFEIKKNEASSDNSTSTPTANAGATKTVKADDPNADYSLSTVVVIIIDIVFIAILAGLTYTIFSKKK